MSEKRQFERVAFDREVSIEANGSTFPGRVRDISVGGAYVVCGDVLTFGTAVKLTLVLPTLSHRGPSALGGIVRWVRSDGFGVQFGPTGAAETYALAEIVARQTNQI